MRVDILHDVGDSLNPGVDRGQIEGGFVQGMGWLTGEELKWDAGGPAAHALGEHLPDPVHRRRARATSTSTLLRERRAARASIHGSKAVGEPPLMLAICVREAIRDAVAAFGAPGGEVALPVARDARGDPRSGPEQVCRSGCRRCGGRCGRRCEQLSRSGVNTKRLPKL